MSVIEESNKISAGLDGSEITATSFQLISQNNPRMTVRTRRMVAAEGSKLKGTSTLTNNTSVSKISSQLQLLEENSIGTDDNFKFVNQKKNRNFGNFNIPSRLTKEIHARMVFASGFLSGLYKGARLDHLHL